MYFFFFNFLLKCVQQWQQWWNSWLCWNSNEDFPNGELDPRADKILHVHQEHQSCLTFCVYACLFFFNVVISFFSGYLFNIRISTTWYSLYGARTTSCLHSNPWKTQRCYMMITRRTCCWEAMFLFQFSGSAWPLGLQVLFGSFF